jgi:type II secretory pathway component PulK
MKCTRISSIIRSRIRSKLSGQDGIALLMVLVVITILTTLVVSFTETTQKHLKVTQYSKNRLQAYWAAQSGLQAATSLLRMAGQAALPGTTTPDADGATSHWNCESDGYQEVVPLLLANIFCGSSMLEPALLMSDPSESVWGLTPSRCPSAVPILDENRKLSVFKLLDGTIASATEETNDQRFEQLRFLLQYLLKEADFSPEEADQGSGLSLSLKEETKISDTQAKNLVGYLVDWIDTENNKSTEYNFDTAELSCPEDGLPYEAKNGMLDSIDEIGLVCGFRQLPRPTIERLARHLTAYNLVTNINTATYPVLHALCAAFSGFAKDKEAEEIFEVLHYDTEDQPPDILTKQGSYNGLLDNYVAPDLADYLEQHTAVKSDHFRIGVYGLVFNMENGTVLARARLQMDLKKRGTGNDFDVLYYRED